jgi:outer membrane murein-binding lipoprotein Lpp
MIKRNVRSVIAFGLFATTVSLLSGCAATADPNRVPMNARDLNWFQPDCRQKEAQIAMLQSMRQSADEALAARFRNILQPWKIVTNPQEFRINDDIGYGNHNHYINFHLNQLRYCP